MTVRRLKRIIRCCPNIAGIVFVNSITTPYGETLESLTNPWIESLIETVNKGIPVYLFFGFKEEGGNSWAGEANHYTLLQIEELASTPDSGIEKVKDYEPEFVISKLINEVVYSISKNGENSGYLYTFEDNASSFQCLDHAVRFILRCLFPNK